MINVNIIACDCEPWLWAYCELGLSRFFTFQRKENRIKISISGEDASFLIGTCLGSSALGRARTDCPPSPPKPSGLLPSPISVRVSPHIGIGLKKKLGN